MNNEITTTSRPSALRTAEFYAEFVSYDPHEGLFTWKKKCADKCVIGGRVGSRMPVGYVVCQILGKRIYAHRLAWILYYGWNPKELIDHINGVRDDNRICNLRTASPAENSRNCKKSQNNTSGIKGVSWVPSRGKWLAQIAVGGGTTRNLGRFHTKHAAAAAYAKASAEIHGAFSRLS